MKFITVGWDKDPPLKALIASGAGSEGVGLLIAFTDNVEGDSRSRKNAEGIAELVRRGGAKAEIFEIPLTDIGKGLKSALDAVEEGSSVYLAGGPRLLNVLVFTAAMLRGAKIYSVPEYEGPIAEITPLSAVLALPCVDEVKAAILSAMDSAMTQSDIARAAGKHQATVSRNLDTLIALGLVEDRGGRPKRYQASPLAKLMLPYVRIRCR
nr:MAG: hypothetical protein TU35_08410 [Thermoproteus sp. AZ2]